MSWSGRSALSASAAESRRTTPSPLPCPNRENGGSKTPTFDAAPSTSRARMASPTLRSSCPTPSRTRQTVRLFLAINLPAEVRHAIVEAAAPLREAAPELPWVPAEKLHLTVKFLGNQSDEMADSVTKAMQDVAKRNRGIDAELGGVGAFPNFRRPRVVWLGVSPEPKLELLHHDVEASCEVLGLPVEGRPFRPHLTLARVRPRSLDGSSVRKLGRAATDVDYVEEIVINAIDLMESELTTTGARYRLIASFPLRV